MNVAVFRPGVANAGRTLAYESERFSIDAVPVPLEHVLRWDAAGELEWAYDGLREWANGLSVPGVPSVPQPAAGPPASPFPVVTPAAIAKDDVRTRRWLWPATALIAFFVVVVWATVLAGGLVRDSIGVAFTLLAVMFVILLVWSMARPESLERRLSQGTSSRQTHRRLSLIVASLLGVSIVCAAVLWWMPHYQVIAPTDKRVILTAKPMMTVKVKNRGLFAGTYTGSYALDGIQQCDVQVSLSPGQERSVSLAVPSGTSPGPHLLALGGAQVSAVALRPAKFQVGKLQVEAPVVKIGEDIYVKTSVENVGDIAGTFPGTMEANGQPVGAQPTKIAPGQTLPFVFSFCRRAAGHCRLEVGAARTTIMVVKPIRLPNGHILRRTVSGGNGSLTIKNPLTVDAMVLLTRAANSRIPVLAVYMRARSTTTVNNMPDGSYVPWACDGKDWNSYTRGFLTILQCQRSRSPLAFSTSSWTSHWTTYSTWYVTSWSQLHTSATSWEITLGTGSDKDYVVTPARTLPKL